MAETVSVTLADMMADAGGSAPELARYKLESQLGAGAASVVFRCVDSKLNKAFALKVLRPGDSRITGATRFHREARALLELDHPGIVRIIDHSKSDDPLRYVLMELLSGSALSSVIDTRGPMPPLAAAALGHELAAALVAVHGAGLVHRDIKPDNVMLEPNGRVVLVDFGLVKGIRPDSLSSTFLDSETRAVGTPQFTSPEQAMLSTRAITESDFFSLGATLYFAITGRQPFSGADIEEIFNAVRTETPRSPDSGSAALDKVVMALLHKDPNQRLADGEKARRALAQVLEVGKVVSPAAQLAAWLRNEQPVASESLSSTVLMPSRPASPEAPPRRPVQASGDNAPPTARAWLGWVAVAGAVALANVGFALYYLR